MVWRCTGTSSPLGRIRDATRNRSEYSRIGTTNTIYPVDGAMGRVISLDEKNHGGRRIGMVKELFDNMLDTHKSKCHFGFYHFFFYSASGQYLVYPI